MSESIVHNVLLGVDIPCVLSMLGMEYERPIKEVSVELYPDMPTTKDVDEHVTEEGNAKLFKSFKYNYVYDKISGRFARWGSTPEEDPAYGPSPEIADIEISVDGCPENCAFCYKDNKPTKPTNMKVATFKQILDKMPKALTQIALGITGMRTNPDLIPIMEACREKGVVPNFTLTGSDLTKDLATKSAKLAGALAVSVHLGKKDLCYETVRLYNALGQKQVNIHLMLAQETEDFAYDVMDDVKNDKRLKNLNALVFLGVKPKGRAKGSFHTLSQPGYDKLVDHCLQNEMRFGFDSCSAPKFESAVTRAKVSNEFKKAMKMRSESCESDLFSCYINVKGEFWHCSFAEEEPTFGSVNVLEAEDFVRDVWYAKEVMDFRTRSLASMMNGCRRCIAFNEINI